MIINIIGECDKRPVLYTLMKICQTLGDVLVISNDSRLMRLSDTRESGGHYQNTMIAVTQEGIDDFMEEFTYSYADFDYVLVDNILTGDADLTIYVRGMVDSEYEQDMLEYLEGYEVINLFEGKMTFGGTLWYCEEFEAYRTMCPMGPEVCSTVSNIFAKVTGSNPESILGIATQPTSMHKPKSNFKLPFGKGGKR